jgi:3-hydroxyacyl-[acyl-carrier-protein] dehydratase
VRFFLVDRVKEFVVGQRVVAIKNVTLEAPYFDHHFPALPVFPGVLVIEAMAQASGYLINRTAEERENKKTLPMMVGVARARFLRAVRPGDQLIIEASLVAHEPHFANTQASVRVEGDVVARADLKFAIREFKGEPEYREIIEQNAVLKRLYERSSEDYLYKDEER